MCINVYKVWATLIDPKPLDLDLNVHAFSSDTLTRSLQIANRGRKH